MFCLFLVQAFRTLISDDGRPTYRAGNSQGAAAGPVWQPTSIEALGVQLDLADMTLL